MKQNIFTTIFIALFSLAIFSTITSKTANSYFRAKSYLQFDKEFSGKIKVIDGDSIKVGNKEVRLFGIDAPEYKQTCLNKNNQPYSCGKASLKFLKNLAHGKNANCIYDIKDKYNRFLAKCFINETSINQQIVANGMAVIYNFNESDKEMEQLENKAKKQKIGIWQGSFQLPKDYRKTHKRH